MSLRRGVSLVEVLLVVAIIALLLALVMPAIQKVREVANKMQCADNLRKIAMASHSYHADWNHLPPGYYGPVRANGGNTKNDIKRGPWVGCLVMLLPYLEEDILFRDLRATPRSFPTTGTPSEKTPEHWCDLGEECAPWFSDPANLLKTTGGKRIPVFECPSDDVYTPTSVGVVVQLYVANDELAHTTLPESSGLGRTNYVGCAGAAGDYDIPSGPYLATYRGVYFNRSKWTLGQLTVMDGTSNTLMFGETLGGSPVGGRDTALSWFGVGSLGTAYGLGSPRLPHSGLKPPPILTVPPPGRDGAAWYRFSSWHSAGVQFAFGDGSVHTIKYGSLTTTPTINVYTSNWALLQMMAGVNDGLMWDTSSMPD